MFLGNFRFVAGNKIQSTLMLFAAARQDSPGSDFLVWHFSHVDILEPSWWLMTSFSETRPCRNTIQPKHHHQHDDVFIHRLGVRTQEPGVAEMRVPLASVGQQKQPLGPGRAFMTMSQDPMEPHGKIESCSGAQCNRDIHRGGPAALRSFPGAQWNL